MENRPFIEDLPIKMVIFYGHISLPEGKNQGNILWLCGVFFLRKPWESQKLPLLWTPIFRNHGFFTWLKTPGMFRWCDTFICPQANRQCVPWPHNKSIGKFAGNPTTVGKTMSITKILQVTVLTYVLGGIRQIPSHGWFMALFYPH